MDVQWRVQPLRRVGRRGLAGGQAARVRPEPRVARQAVVERRPGDRVLAEDVEPRGHELGLVEGRDRDVDRVRLEVEADREQRAADLAERALAEARRAPYPQCTGALDE